MTRTARMGLLLSTLLLGACAEGLYCEGDAHCGPDEWCDPAARQCLPIACRGQPAGTPIRCEEDILWACGEAGEPLPQQECPYGCSQAAEAAEAEAAEAAVAAKCRDCVPGTLQCHGPDLVQCNAQGQVQTTEHCDHGCSAERSMCHACTPAQDYCEADQLVTCDDTGLPGESTTCEHGCNQARATCNECAPGGVACDGSHRITCGTQGQVAISELCVHGCNDQRAQCNECTPATTQCTSDGNGDGNGDELALCGPDGLPGGQVPCPLGCNPSALPARCYTFTPTGLAESDLHAGQVDLVVASAATLTIDTDALTVAGAAPGSWRVATQAGGGPELFVAHYREISVQEGATITVQGSRGLALVASGPMEILGTIDAAAHHDLPGPGGRSAHASALAPFSGDGGPGTQIVACDSTQTGGGGGAQGASGGSGGGTVLPTHAGGAGGTAATSTPWLPLLGGGMGGQSASGLQSGGAGGGVLLLVSAQELVIGCAPASSPTTGPLCGSINVSGGGGPGQGAGGGAGGTVLLEAPSVELGGGLYAVGGGGACGGAPWPGTGGGTGGVPTGVPTAGPGTDGAAGGRGCYSATQDGGGGNGGLADNRLYSDTGGPGANVLCGTPSSAGGGGGSAGRLRIRAAPGQLTVLATATLRGATCGGYLPGCFAELVGE